MATRRAFTAPTDDAYVGLVDLVLAGGGAKGAAYVGALRALEARGYTVHPRVAGTSVGALVGAVVAAGADAARVQELMEQLPADLFTDDGDASPFSPRSWPLVGPLASIRSDGGRYATDALMRWIQDEVEELQGLTFGELRARRAVQMAERGIDWDATLDPLVILATDITNGVLVQFPQDLAAYADAEGMGIDPDDVLVVDAIRASVSVPFYFKPFAYGGATFVDGGVLANFAVDIFDRPDHELEPRWPTFGFTIAAKDQAQALGAGLVQATYDVRLGLGDLVVDQGGDIAESLIGTLVTGQDRDRSRRWWMARRVVDIDTSSVGIVDFEQAVLQRSTLLSNGFRATEAFLDDVFAEPGDPGWGSDGRARFLLPPRP